MALARARIMGARYPFYLLADSRDGQLKEAEVSGKWMVTSGSKTSHQPPATNLYNNIRHGFVYERAVNVTSGSIANNAEIDVIWDQWQAKLEPLHTALNKALGMNWQEWEIPRDLNEKSLSGKAEFEYLYDKPYSDNKKVRVAGPFTVESLSPHHLNVDLARGCPAEDSRTYVNRRSYVSGSKF